MITPSSTWADLSPVCESAGLCAWPATTSSSVRSSSAPYNAAGNIEHCLAGSCAQQGKRRERKQAAHAQRALVLAGIAHTAHVAFGVHGNGAGEIFGQRKRRVAVKRRFEHAQQLAL